ncbi:Lipopolysaccharide export system protein LptA [Usitatibacter rugosus]|uniref:Lipopolysaccharide export system protein LptA n=1 Tax=Usitatibacter rugosus TaxID=2732067 RepID=A0A6M4GPP0_9PROT|nr:lipopolysaccharide transport periplasmic protein LptA [Usitatibacter rugosus]QJR09035.1 Lipopolysaccharide export system protein LptA [Usitatibacter rugosus]
MRTLRLTLLTALALAALPVLAEKSDREKEINIGADLLTGDDNARVTVFDGNVVITQGTMRITANKVTVKEDAERNKFYVANGAPVTFRQKRDKAEDFIEGWAARAEFDDKSSKLKLFDKARLKSVQGEITGDLITYDTSRELFEVGAAQPGTPGSRVKATLVPQKKDAKDGKDAKSEAKPSSPLTLKSDSGPATH